MLLQTEWSDNPQDLLKLSLPIGKVLLSLETKLTRLEAANHKALEQVDIGYNPPSHLLVYLQSAALLMKHQLSHPNLVF